MPWEFKDEISWLQEKFNDDALRQRVYASTQKKIYGKTRTAVLIHAKRRA